MPSADNKKGGKTMDEKSPDYATLRAKVLELASGPDNRAAVAARLKKLSSGDIPKKTAHRDELIANKQQILDRVQKRAEEYEQVDQNCAKSPALAVMEEFGFGNIKIISALSALPGVALTGETCGAILGGLVALSAYFGSKDLLDYSANARSYAQSRKFIYLFEKELGTTKCRTIHENVIFGQYYNVADIKEGYPAFVRDKGFEKCALPSGVSARICAEIIIQDMERKK
jgi:C_GCAxxG_C_C family probable redox protein